MEYIVPLLISAPQGILRNLHTLRRKILTCMTEKKGHGQYKQRVCNQCDRHEDKSNRIFVQCEASSAL